MMNGMSTRVRPSDCAATVRLVSRTVAANPQSRMEEMFMPADPARSVPRGKSAPRSSNTINLEFETMSAARSGGELMATSDRKVNFEGFGLEGKRVECEYLHSELELLRAIV